MNALRSTYCILISIILFATGCTTRRPDPNPLVGWKKTRSQATKDVDKAIRDDYLDYIGNLPPEERKIGALVNFYEDGTGRHAVRIEIPIKGEFWQYLLIYDQNNRRLQAIKRYAGHYQS